MASNKALPVGVLRAACKQKGLPIASLFVFAISELFFLLVLGGSNSSFERCTGGEFRHGGRGDLDLFARLRVLTFACGTSSRFEGTEADETYAIALGNSVNDGFDHGIKRFAGSNL